MTSESLQDINPVCELQYVAFRAAFLMTLDCLLNQHVCDDIGPDVRCGFLDQSSLMASTAPQVQLELLLKTWKRLAAMGTSAGLDGQTLSTADLVVIQCATEHLAAIALAESQSSLLMAGRGPRRLATAIDGWLYSKVRWLQAANYDQAYQRIYLDLPVAGASQLQAVADELSGKKADLEQLMAAIGQWKIDRAVLTNLDDLLTKDEQDLLTEFFQEHPSLLS